MRVRSVLLIRYFGGTLWGSLHTHDAKDVVVLGAPGRTTRNKDATLAVGALETVVGAGAGLATGAGGCFFKYHMPYS